MQTQDVAPHSASYTVDSQGEISEDKLNRSIGSFRVCSGSPKAPQQHWFVVRFLLEFPI